jgi:exodeoxyribonuclease VII large subunit
MTQAMARSRDRTEAVAQKLAPAQLEMRLAKARMRFETAESESRTLLEARLQTARKQLGVAAASLDALSPLGVLERGYAIAQDKNGRLLRDAQSVSVGDTVRLRLAKGQLKARVEQIEATDKL